MKWAVFMDRDGTVNEEVGYLDDPAGLRLLPGAGEAIRRLNAARVPVLLVTNQSAIARGYLPAARLQAVHQELARQLAAHGAHIDHIYHCPHHPDENCSCRKPQPGMLQQAAAEHGIELADSFIVGDKGTDLEAGRRVGCRTVLVLTGYGPDERRRLETAGPRPDFVARDLSEAVEWILTRQREEAGDD
ncbi:MAG: HAD family hydrolase [Anaerolineae bacterium]|nr:HAD family hydrolase [Anaerolineae bacterium]